MLEINKLYFCICNYYASISIDIMRLYVHVLIFAKVPIQTNFEKKYNLF